MEDEYNLLLQYAFNNADLKISKITDEIIKLDGMCGEKAKHYYNNLLDFEDQVRYLEIGSWKGSSICSAMYNNKYNNSKFLCIDNWNVVGGKDEFINNIQKYKGTNEINYLDIDYLNNFPNIDSKFNIYVYDGDYMKDSNFKALVNYYNYLDDAFIYIKNDWNEKNVRDETEEAIKKLNLKIMYKKEIIEAKSIKNWWNGICFFIFKK